MSYYIARSDFFKMLCETNKKVAHGTIDTNTGDVRNSFFRLNNNEEAIAQALNGMHLPAVIHSEYSVRPVLKGEDERVQITNELVFLCKPTDTTADAIQQAYNMAETVLEEFVQWMLNAYEEDGSCGPFKMIDLSMFSWDPIGPFMNDFYGFALTIREEQRATALTNFNPNNWL